MSNFFKRFGDMIKGKTETSAPVVSQPQPEPVAAPAPVPEPVIAPVVEVAPEPPQKPKRVKKVRTKYTPNGVPKKKKPAPKVPPPVEDEDDDDDDEDLRTPPPVNKKKVKYPYLEARIFTTEQGQLMTSVDFNEAFVAQVDIHFRNDPIWAEIQEDNVKVALFLHSIFTKMVEPYLPDEAEPTNQLQESFEQIPLLAVRGGEENVTRVDLSTTPGKRIGEF